MSLKAGIGVGVALLTAAVVVAFGVGSDPGFVVQLVDADGQPVLAWGSDEPLPFASPTAPLLVAGRPFLVGSAPWRGAGATIRIAHDLGDALATRRELLRSLAVGGAPTFLLASLVAVVAVRRALAPLDRVAVAARNFDAAAPDAIRYEGGLTEIRSLTGALNHALAAIRERTRSERVPARGRARARRPADLGARPPGRGRAALPGGSTAPGGDPRRARGAAHVAGPVGAGARLARAPTRAARRRPVRPARAGDRRGSRARGGRPADRGPGSGWWSPGSGSSSMAARSARWGPDDVIARRWGARRRRAFRVA